MNHDILKQYAVIDLHMDSLAEAYNFPLDYNDPTYTEVSERLIAIANRYNFKYSIFVLGKDLERSEENASIVKKWAEEGHEIGNHTYSHPTDIGSFSKENTFNEIHRSHQIITEVLGYEPKGYVSPNWSTSNHILDSLIELKYDYDTSLFPSILRYPLTFKILLNFIGDKKFIDHLKGTNFIEPLFSKRLVSKYKNHNGEITILPIPTNVLRIATWHTTAFLFGWNMHEKILKSCLKHSDCFYYVIHPADVISEKDLDTSRPIHLERLNFPLQQKLDLLEKAINTILESGRKIVTFKDLLRLSS
jgi:peptidoglycan/xylan/chitin deacetylase (PgdA/CDA1 family)